MLALLFSLLQVPTPVQIQVGQVSVIAAPSQLSLAMRLAEMADRAQDWPGVGRRPPGPMRLIVVADPSQMEAVSSGRAPSWGAGLALPGIRTIILRSDLPAPDHTLRHELAHLALHDAVRVRVPLWFDEGYASWASGEWDRLETLRLNLAVAAGQVPDFRELDGMLRGSANAADLAYGLAASAVLELARRNPARNLDALIAHLAGGESFETSVLATTGLSVPRFESEWRQAIRRRYNVVTWLLAGGFWSVVAFSLGGLLWYRRRRDIPRRAALDVGWTVPDAALPVEEVSEPPPVDPTDNFR